MKSKFYTKLTHLVQKLKKLTLDESRGAKLTLIELSINFVLKKQKKKKNYIYYLVYNRPYIVMVYYIT